MSRRVTSALPTALLGAALLCAAAACSDAVGSSRAASPPVCVRATVTSLALAEDPECAIASSALAAERFPDLRFTPGTCYAIAEVDAALALPDGRVVPARIRAHSGISANPLAGAGLVPLPAPLVAPDGSAHVYLPFAAASVIEVRAARSGELVGELATRDAGWAEIAGGSTLPAYVSERLVVTGGTGPLADAVGDLFAAGDEFSGVPVAGSICGPDLADRLARAL